MPIAVFRPSFLASPWANEEWIVFNDATSTRLRYWKISPGAGSFSALTDIAMLYSGNYGIATNRTFVFVGGGVSPDCRQLAWNGSTLTQRHSGDPGAATSNGFNNEFYFAPNNPGYVLSAGAGDFGDGIQAWSFASAPAYAYGTPTNFDPAGSGQSGFLDFRVGAVGVQGYGNTFLHINGSHSQIMYAMSVSGTTVTGHTNLTVTNSGLTLSGADRDTGLIAMVGTSATSVYIATMNMTSRALANVGIGTITGTTLICCTAHKGFVVTYENTGKVRCYSRSGSTLTLVNTLDMGGSPARGMMRVSPYTNLIYLISGVSGQSRVIELSDAGVLASKVTLTGVTMNGGGITAWPLAWLPAALPTV